MIRLPRHWLVPCLSLVTAAALGLSAFAQSDLIREAKQRQEVATQAAEADLKAALRKADAMSKADALDLLKQTRTRIEDNLDLNPERQRLMVRTLNDRIRLTELSARTSGESTTGSRASARKAELERQAAEADKIREALKQINQLDYQGRKDEAQRQIDSLRNQYPDNPAVRALARSARVQSGVREAKDVLDKQDRSAMGMIKDLKESSTPPAGDVDFDKKRWAEISKVRGKGDKLTEKEKSLLTALNEPVKAEWRNTKFSDVIDYLSTVSKQTIVIDKKALEDQNVNYEDSVVNFTAPKTISMRTALRKVLHDFGLTYVIKDELIYVTTPEKARNMMVTRVYPIGDLVTGQGVMGNPFQVGPVLAAQNEQTIAKMIVDMIKESIDPMSWQGNSGQGTITYSPINKAIIVRQSSEIQLMLKGSLGGGK
jgi:hypothetical protein